MITLRKKINHQFDKLFLLRGVARLVKLLQFFLH